MSPMAGGSAEPTMLHEDLFGLLRNYRALVPTRLLPFPSNLPVLEVHQFLLDHILLSKHLQTYPASDGYQYSFWKWAIKHLEDMVASSAEDVELDTRIYDKFISLMPPSGTAIPQTAPPPASYITYFWKPTPWDGYHDLVDLASYRTVTLLESCNTIENGTTGLLTWPASFFLTQYLISHTEVITDKRILELGSGAGFLGAIVARLGALTSTYGGSSLWLSDVSEEVLTRCRSNIQLPCNLSSSQPNVHYRLLDWSHALDPVTLPRVRSLLQEIDAELILGADIVFDPKITPALVAILRLALQGGNHAERKEALIALTLRNETTYSEFLRLAGQFFVVQDLLVQDYALTLFPTRGNNTFDHKILRICSKYV